MIRVRGARAHNLGNVDVELPAGKLVVVAGPSGAGKSTLLFDVIHREGLRRFVEAQGGALAGFFGEAGAADVDEIEGLPPTLALRAPACGASSRTTVATLSECAPPLRRLFAAFGTARCPECGRELRAWTAGEVARDLVARFEGVPARVTVGAARAGLPEKEWLQAARAAGYARMAWGGEEHDLESWIAPRPLPEDAEIVVDRFRVDGAKTRRVADSCDAAFHLGRGVLAVEAGEGESLRRVVYCAEARCPDHGAGAAAARPSLFSFNHPDGACSECGGSGVADKKKGTPCARCGGTGLDPKTDVVTLGGKTFRELGALTVSEALDWLENSAGPEAASSPLWKTAAGALAERLRLLESLGLSHLQLARRGNALSGGEALRVRLAAQLGTRLSGVLVLADEPLAGLHPKDAENVWAQLVRLRDAGNSVAVVEHVRSALERADWLLELGPEGGARGGEVVYAGPPSGIFDCARSATAPYLRNPPRVARAERPRDLGRVVLRGARGRNLKNVDLSVPLGRLVCVSGVSGSGKSSLVVDTFAAALLRAQGREADPLPYGSLEGAESLGFVRLLRQGELQGSSRSVVATALGVWDELRGLLAQSPEAKLRGWGPGRFSFNVKGGRCERCGGEGTLRLDPEALPDLRCECPDCRGRRFDSSTLEARFKGLDASEILDLDVDAAAALFRGLASLSRPLETMREVGLGYLKLGQPVEALSAGEGQRLRLAAELGRGLGAAARNARPGIFVLDEPARGLHFGEVERLLRLFRKLTEAGHAVLIVEHREEMLEGADVKIEMGPGGGPFGGRIVEESA